MLDNRQEHLITIKNKKTKNLKCDCISKETTTPDLARLRAALWSFFSSSVLSDKLSSSSLSSLLMSELLEECVERAIPPGRPNDRHVKMFEKGSGWGEKVQHKVINTENAKSSYNATNPIHRIVQMTCKYAHDKEHILICLLVKPSGWPTAGVGPDAWWPCSRVLLGGRPAASSCLSPWSGKTGHVTK